MNESPEKEEIRYLSPDCILFNPRQPRSDFKPEELEELAQSIRSVGLIHPPLVRPLPDSSSYELISGERRLRAVRMIGLREIPVCVRLTSETLSAQSALIENIQRVDLNPLEIAKSLQKLMVECALSQERLAEKIGKKRSTVANYLRLLALPPNIRESLSGGFITMGHAKAILSLTEEDRQRLLHELILRDDLNVRETEAAAARIGKKALEGRLQHVSRDFYLEHLEKKIREATGTKATIRSKGKRGRLILEYYGNKDLERLLVLLGVTQDE